jgi:two-component system CheB/CheR fusion protein
MKDQQLNINEVIEKNNQVVVAIGASAGGLEALQDFFKSMPIDTSLAFVVIQHLSPDYKSMMDELLARQTKMKIFIIEDGMHIDPNCIYLIPPRKNLSIFHNQLFLEDYNLKKGLNLPIDIFFRSLALEKGKNGIGVILSGTGSDGALGTRAIKEAAGMIMVQDETAKFDGMPRSSIQTGVVDFILAPDKMPTALLDYVKHPFIQKNSTTENILSRDYDNLTKITLILRDFCGIDYSYYKSNTIIRRLERRISINRCNSVEEYLILLSESDKEKETLFRDLLIGVTRFFRDPEAFNFVAENVIPTILKSKNKIIRIWSAACSTGEEVYSLAIKIAEILETITHDVEVKIFATDIDRQSLTIAGQGFYPDNIMVDVDALLLSKYFNRVEGGYQVKEQIRRMVVFATHNLLKDPPFSKLDLIVCRNLFIYLKQEVQLRILSMFYQSLNTNGFLFMGSSESIGEMTDAFSAIDSKNKIYQQKSGFKPNLAKDIGIIIDSKKMYNDNQSFSSKLLPAAKNERLLEKVLPLYMPPSIIIDLNDNIVQIIGDVNLFTTINQGRFTQNLYAILPDSLGRYVSSFIRRLRKQNKSLRSDGFVPIKELDNNEIRVEGHNLETDKNFYNLIVFEFKVKADEIDYKYNTIQLSDEYSDRIISLERELQYNKEALQATIEELETSNEELQSSNEELIASNEELQSTNEELQSVNEELYTVNSEYQLKIEELERLNNDMSNLLNNTEIGAIYLDRNLCIRKITPIVSKITNIIISDIGRPISHISSFNYNQPIMDDVLLVTETLQVVENEFIDPKGNCYLVRIRPYRIDSNAVDGILITFVNINNYKEEQKKVSILSQRLSDSLSIGKMAWWEWNVITGLVTFDPKKATMIGYTVEEFPTDVFKICDLIHPDDYENTMQIMHAHLEGKTSAWVTTYRIKRKDGGYGWYYDRGEIIERNADGKPTKLIGTVIDVTELKTIESELFEYNNFLHQSFKNETLPKFIINTDGALVDWNNAIYELSCKYIDCNFPKDINDWQFINTDGIILNKCENPLLKIETDEDHIKSIRIKSQKTDDIHNFNVRIQTLFENNGNRIGFTVTFLKN